MTAADGILDPVALEEIRRRHWGEGNIPEHQIERMPCDVCRLLVTLDARPDLTPPTVDEMKELGALYLEPHDLFAPALIGVIHQAGINVALYSMTRTIDVLIKDIAEAGWSEDPEQDAIDHYNHNVSGSIGIGFPQFLIDDVELERPDDLPTSTDPEPMHWILSPVPNQLQIRMAMFVPGHGWLTTYRAIGRKPVYGDPLEETMALAEVRMGLIAMSHQIRQL